MGFISKYFFRIHWTVKQARRTKRVEPAILVPAQAVVVMVVQPVLMVVPVAPTVRARAGRRAAPMVPGLLTAGRVATTRLGWDLRRTRPASRAHCRHFPHPDLLIILRRDL